VDPDGRRKIQVVSIGDELEIILHPAAEQHLVSFIQHYILLWFNDKRFGKKSLP
jgi:hypothetical protein